MRVLVVNGGSSSLKLRLLDEGDRLVASAVARRDDMSAIRRFVDRCGDIDAVGHRVVHGGDRYVQPVRLDDRVLAELDALAPLAPLHQPISLAGVRAMAALVPGVPAVACFDTAFHATIPAAAATYPLPAEWRDRYGLRRYGFHGLSHAYASRRTREVVGAPAGRLVTCHLGAGSSVTAVVDGLSVDTTMGFTPNEGVPMATRSGSVDIGMLTWLLGAGVSPGELDDGLQRRSGLRGLAGDGDMRAVEARAVDGDPRARLAVDVWVHRVRQAIASMAASAGGLDALTFTGGIGENAHELRQAIAAGLSWLGIAVDDAANQPSSEDRDVTAPEARVKVVVVHAREDIEIARGTRQALAP